MTAEAQARRTATIYRLRATGNEIDARIARAMLEFTDKSAAWCSMWVHERMSFERAQAWRATGEGQTRPAYWGEDPIALAEIGTD